MTYCWKICIKIKHASQEPLWLLVHYQMVLGATLKGKVDIFDGVAMTSPLGPVLANISNYVS